MILSRRVTLGDVQLDEVDESIVIQSIIPGAAKRNTQSVNRMGGYGNRITQETWDPMETQVTFAINKPKKELAARRTVYDLVTVWAMKGGWLKTNEMPGRAMYVERAYMPAGSDMRDWLKEYTISFRNFSVPFWQDEAPISGSTGVANESAVVLTVGGNIRTVMDLYFTNMSGRTINDLTITIGKHGKLQLANLGLPGGGAVYVNHENDGVMRVTMIVNGVSTSIMEKMDASSTDDTYANPGQVTVSFAASRAGVLSASCRGRYL